MLFFYCLCWLAGIGRLFLSVQQLSTSLTHSIDWLKLIASSQHWGINFLFKYKISNLQELIIVLTDIHPFTDFNPFTHSLTKITLFFLSCSIKRSPDCLSFYLLLSFFCTECPPVRHTFNHCSTAFLPRNWNQRISQLWFNWCKTHSLTHSSLTFSFPKFMNEREAFFID